MSEERIRILDMLERGQINASEAAELLKAVSASHAETQAERQRILDLLEHGHIGGSEAVELLKAVGDLHEDAGARREGSDEERTRRSEPAQRPHGFRIRVTNRETGAERVNLVLPLELLSLPLGMTGGLGFPFGGLGGFGGGPGFSRRHWGRGLENVIDAIREGRRGIVYESDDAFGGDHVEFTIE